MGAAVCIDGPVTTSRTKPLVLRYLLHAHAGAANADRAAAAHVEFAKRPPFEVVKATVKHQAWDVRRR
jgi:hypothetical protein